MTVIDHLRAVLVASPEAYDMGTTVCAHCRGEWLGRDQKLDHAPDCPWAAAKGFVEEIDAMAIEARNLERQRLDLIDLAERTRPGFTLLELLVVIAIILLVSAVALPMIAPALSHRQVSEGARLMQAQLAGARDAAIRDNQPRGIRLLPDPAFPLVRLPNGQIDPTQPLAANRVIPIGSAPDYREGLLSTASDALRATVSPLPCVMVYESITDANGLPANPTSWFYNVRVGDKIQINNAGPTYSVVGPMVVDQTAGNSELFVNGGPPGTLSPLIVNGLRPEYLLLVNGKDDNANGWIDEGFDGIDNDANGTIDEAAEWEAERFSSVAAGLASVPYTIHRRPAPVGNARELALPTNVVVDLSTWGTTLERSRLPVNPYTGYVDILLNPNGTAVLTTIYSAPAIVGMAGSFLHFWVAERSDVHAPAGVVAPALPLPPSTLDAQPGRFNVRLAGEYRLVTLFTRTGQTAQAEDMPFDWPDVGHTPPFTAANPAYFAGLPFTAIQQGAR